MRAFGDVLRQISGGELYEDLTGKMTEVVDAVMETGKPGEITLTLKIAKNGESAVLIKDSVKVKVPERARDNAVFYVVDGDLQREDPRQGKLPLRDVTEPKTTIRGESKESVVG